MAPSLLVWRRQDGAETWAGGAGARQGHRRRGPCRRARLSGICKACMAWTQGPISAQADGPAEEGETPA